VSDRGAMLNAAGESVAVEPIDFDDLGDDEVLVRLTASGVCHTDLHVKERAQTSGDAGRPRAHASTASVRR